jgi:hypothetical protein
MAKKAAKTRRAKPEVKEEPESLGGGQEGHGFAPRTISKSEAVRRAVDDGADQPLDGVAYIKSHFGLEIGPQHFSAVKSGYLKKKGVATPNTRFQKKAEPAERQPPPVNGETDLLAAMEAVKPLVASLGADKVKRIVDLLG